MFPLYKGQRLVSLLELHILNRMQFRLKNTEYELDL